MDCMEVPSLGSLLRKRSREGSKRMWEEEQGEEEEGWGIKEEVLWGKRKGKVCEVMQLAAALCGGQLLYSPCCIVPPFCLADPFFYLPILWSLVVAAVSSPHISIHLLSSQHVSLYSNRISVTLFGELLYLYWYTYVTTKNRYGAQQARLFLTLLFPGCTFTKQSERAC